jgi:Leucine-rich repeat (LRR) protein
MIEDLELQKKGIITLIESWNNDNINLALEILKGNPDLHKVVKEHYKDLLKVIFSRVVLDDFINFPQKLANEIRANKQLPQLKLIEEILPQVPITRLSLSTMNIEFVPWWVFRMTQLKELDLSSNNIRVLAPEIKLLTDLQVLNLNHNLLKELPQEIGEMENLEKLQLDFNFIEVIPEKFGMLHNLKWLCLEANNIELLPKSLAGTDEITGLTSLYWLSIEKTPLGDRFNIKGGKYLDIRDELFLKLLG